MTNSTTPQTHTIPAEYLTEGDVIVGYEKNGPVLQAKYADHDTDLTVVRWANDAESFYVEDEVEVLDRYLADGRPVRTAGDPNPLLEGAAQGRGGH